ncbi:P-loop containing nucleoside triphosphate hydrolase [Pseudocohnilembus persalinus]|uniref:p-loop containing nucleoside triphosphate hydrolase n=1 Tax=Pseudocohnilembus persalinus TaxID=266149 RepID=A0A0V0R299_PSEPJ|nr:P-loop containing nucleoside triphosphate hydrolase [Pseudocohnilembus persalinus]|eukprot:KRX08296.1 P-loop containing nucleoside triphosphate hydrolase [Pseudocohnilembus persalinus]
MQKRPSVKRNTRAISMGHHLKNQDNHNQFQQSNNNIQEDITHYGQFNNRKYSRAKQELVQRLFAQNNQSNMPSVQKTVDKNHKDKNRGLIAKIAIENWQKSDTINQCNEFNANTTNQGNNLPPILNNSKTPSQNFLASSNINTTKNQRQVRGQSMRSFSLNKTAQNSQKPQLFGTQNYEKSLINQNQNINNSFKEQSLNQTQIQNKNKNLTQHGFQSQEINFMSNYSHLNMKYNRPKHHQRLLGDPLKAIPVKNLIDKMVGPIDIRYQNVDQNIKSTAKKYDNINLEAEYVKNSEQQENQENGIQNGENNSGINNIDIFIALVREHRISAIEFIYLIKEKHNSNDAYNLKVYRYEKLVENKIVNYYTLSSKGVTRYVNNRPTEFVSLGDWLKERDQFNMIKNLQFFRKFRKWKTLKQWKHFVFKERLVKVQKSLNEKLFILNPIYQQTLLEHRSISVDFERLRFVNVSEQFPPMSLEKFGEEQAKHRADVVNKLQESSKKLHENCLSGIKKVIDEMRQQIQNGMPNEEEQFASNHNNNQLEMGNDMDEKKQILEKLGFPPNMDYDLRSGMRQEFQRFLRLAYLLDFICVQSLGQIYVGSAFEFLQRIKIIASNTVYKKVLDNPDQFVQEDDPLLEINFETFIKQPLEDFKIEIQEFPASTLKQEKCQTFDLDMHAVIVQEPNQEEGENNQKKGNIDSEGEENLQEDQYDLMQDEDYQDDKLIKKRNVQNIHDCWLQMSPTKEDFFTEVHNIFSEGLDCIQVIERWSKNQMFLPYVKGLEEWDEIIGEKWNKPESYYLNPSQWIKENKFAQTFMKHVKDILFQQFDRIEEFKQEYQPLLNQFWVQQNSDLEVLKNKRLKRQSKIYGWILANFRENLNTLSEKLINEVNLGIFKVNTADIKKAIMPQQKKLVENLDKLLISIYLERGDNELQWLQASIKNLKGPALNIEEFVLKKAALDKIYRELQIRKEELMVLESLFILMTEKQVQEVNSKKVQTLQHQLSKSENDLNAEINEVETSTAQNFDKFKKDLSQYIDQLKENSQEIMEQLRNEKYLDEKTPLEEATKELGELNETMKGYEKDMEKFINYEEILGVQQQANFENLLDAKFELTLRYDMWRGIQEFKQLQSKWSQIPFSEINAKEIAQQTEVYYRTVQKCKKNLSDNKVILMLAEPVTSVRNTMPVVTALRSQYLTETHWEEIKKILNADFDIENPEFTLQKMMDLKAAQFSEEIIEISVRAAQEDAIKIQLVEMEEKWAQVDLCLKSYKERDDIGVLAEIDELIQLFDEGLATMNTILANRFVAPLRKEAQKIANDLLHLQDIIDKWVECQKKWMYLENIFSSPDIIRSLPNESNLFSQCDAYLIKLMKSSLVNPKIMKLLNNPKFPNLLDQLTKRSEQLDKIEKQLEQFLETKRQSFPRFYFISNDELIEILAKASKLQDVEPSIGKCFEGLNKLYMGKEANVANSTLIQGMISPEGEIVQFINKSVKAQGNVELWLDILQKEMYECMKKLIKAGFNNSSNDQLYKSRMAWIKAHKGQVVSVVNQIIWTLTTEDSIANSEENKNAMSDHLEQTILQLGLLTEEVRGQLSSIMRKIIVALITADVHNRDIIQKLDDEEVENLQDFTWQQQLKYRMQGDDCIIHQVTSTLNYGYEYLGATSRLVITPLTDRCWITITSAVDQKLGANPAGPAGTGKTESTKDLAKGLGRLCIVFNCSDQITAVMMNKLFSGLCQQGAWTCLDEFNRIDIEVLSVIAQQLLVIRMALLQKEDDRVSNFDFEGLNIPLKTGYGVFITMNPGYAGRTELPDNLKALFRPVAMMIPDYSMIAEIMLFAEGFQEAQNLSKKMVQLYKLSSEQLSQQDHYDFGMRALKSLLVMAGSLKRAESKLSEDVVLIRAMKDANIPKFLRDDLPLFEALIQDLFPSVEIPEQPKGELENQIVKTLESQKLQKKPEFVTKIIQLFETLIVRFGVMLVGNSGTGKTKCYHTLALAMSKLREKELEKLEEIEKNQKFQQEEEAGEKMKIKINEQYQHVGYHCLNPKSITMGELYGEVDPLTQEWVDGLASSIIRDCNNLAQDSDFDANKREWVVFDGPVDALWIENMNTVLDDNQTLCLANSERIKLREQMRMLFEVQDLAVASPATVSRCGMVYLCHEDLGWHPFVLSWFEQNCEVNQEKAQEMNKIYLEEENLEYVKNSFTNLFDNTCKKFSKCHEPFPTTDIQRAQNICNFLQIYLSKFKNDKHFDENKKKLNHILAFSFIWGVTAGVSDKDYDQLDLVIKDVFQHLRFPKGETIFDFYIDDSQKCFLDWESQLEDFVYEKDCNYFDLLVPTIDTTKYSSILEQLLEIQKPCLFTGPTGTGKSVIIKNLLIKLKSTKATNSIFLNFSAQTNPKQTQLAIESKLNKKGKTLFGARPNEKIVIFIDDINMPALEEYGAQPCIELLRLLVDKQGFFDRFKLFWKNIEDTTLICAGAPAGGGRNQLTPRFVRHFNVFCLPQPSDSTLQKIFGSILKEFLGSTNFSDQLKRLVDAPVNGTIDVYKTISKELLPIPSKFHYTFNLRDISKVFQGMLQIKPQQCQSQESLAKLWVHECSRVFADRLVNQTDAEWFQELIVSIVNRYFGVNMDKEVLFEVPILFSDIMKLEQGSSIYEEIQDRKKFKKALEDKQDDYNFDSTDQLDLVFFEQANEHIQRIARVLRQPRGNCMLIGVGGSGKQSLSKLASFIMKCDVFQIEMIKNYNTVSFREDLQKLLKKTGMEMKPTSFIFTDVQIAYESFLEDINNLLNTGEVPNLFQKKEDIDEIMNGVRSHAIKAKKPDSPDDLWNFFIDNVRKNLHIILCMSPVGSALRIRTRKFPSMIDCCTLDWFSDWPKEALLSVALKFLDQIELPNAQMKSDLAEMCMTVAVDVAETSNLFFNELKRKVYTTPKSYLDQISLYQKLLAKKRDEVNTLKTKLSEGLDKLNKSNQIVASLKIEMQDLQPQLEEQSAKTEIALKQVAEDRQEANEVEAQVSEETQIVNEKAEEIQMIVDEAQQELDKALPALKQAELALNTINKSDIAKIKGYSQPPSGVIMVLSAVCTLLGIKEDWNSAKSMIIEMGFIDKLKNYDKDNVPEIYLRKLRNYTNRAEFDPTYVQKQDEACKSLCMWCLAIDKYSKVAKEVLPKKQTVAKEQKNLAIKQQELKQKQDELDKVKQKVAQLQKDCDDTMAKKQQLQEDLQRTANRLEAAEKLTYLLGDEGVRWKDQIESIGKQLDELIGNVFLSSSIMNYCGPYTIKYREKLCKQWYDQLVEKQIPISENYTLADTMETPINIRDWQLQGLPNDSFSVENAVIATKADRWPLMIDPQGEANKWIKKQLASQNLQIMRFSETHYLKTLQNSITSGYPGLIEEVTEFIDPAIDSVLQKQIFDQEGRKLIRVGDKRVDYDPTFQLFLTTKLSNPHYLPETFIKVTIINFSITFEGLQDQLMSDVMKNEKPEIEQQRDETIVTIANSKKQLQEAQDKILQLLAEAKGMILDDVELIQTLETSKKQSAEIKVKLEETEIIEKQINESRDLYVSISVRGTILYFVISDLAGIDPMYQFSLQYFKKLFNNAMQTTKECNVLEERLTLLKDNITRVIFTDICRGLFESHKRLFSFLITTSIKRQAEEISPAAWNLLIRGPGVQKEGKKDKSEPNPDTNQTDITKQAWFYINTIAQQIEPLQKLPKLIKENLSQWIVWKDSSDIYNELLPSKLQENSGFINFYKLLLIRAFRPEKILHSFSHYISSEMGEFYDTIPSATMAQLYNDSNSQMPIIFILSQGADPTSMLINFSKEQNKDITPNVISLGQGQGKKAEALIERAKSDGSWVLLQNCHLSKSWMPELEKIVQQFNEPGYIQNEDFRLFLTSMPVEYFPVSVLQNGLKLTTEPPRGIKANLSKSFQDLNQEYIDQVEFKKESWFRLFFGLTFFHAVIQERRKFGPLGFNIRYEFNESDLDISKITLKMFLNTQEEGIPYDAMLYMTGHINYGGRVTDDWDRVCLLSILKQFYTSEALEKNYQFSESGLYYAPSTMELAEIQKYINQLPNIDDPEIFGMHENANITFQQQESNKLIETILSIQPRDAGASGGDEGAKSNDEIVTDIAIELEGKLPTLLLKESGLESLFELTEVGAYQSLTTVLLQEIEKFNRLLKVCSNSLSELQKAIKGFVVMSQDLDDMYLAFLNNQLPPIWKKVSYASLKPLSGWFKDLIERVDMMRNWLVNGNPSCYWISGFYFPQGFLTGVLQTHSRKFKIPIDTLSFKFRLFEYDSEYKTNVPPVNGVYIKGLYCDGARWNDKANTLEDQPIGTLYSPMPVIHFIPEENYQVPEDNYLCPLYKTSNRVGVLSTTGQSTNFILAIGIPIKNTKPEFWTLRGTALLTQLDN